jgi:hypothetical protein
MGYAGALRFSSEVKQLRHLMDRVAAKSTEMIALTLTTNTSIEAHLQMPTLIGNNQYWLQIRNDSQNTWLGGGFGGTPAIGTDLHVFLPKEAVGTGYFVGGYGAVRLRCYLDAGVPRIVLESSS